jgi:16S rRNA (uracil1498-N3)-methyltransferase
VNLFYQPLISEGIHHLDEEESKHCTRVLRKGIGDTINITDGKGFFYEAVVRRPDFRKCEFDIQKTLRSPERKFTVHIAVSPTKNADRIEWFVEKATEFGIDQITLINCENTERSFLKVDRLKKLAVSAMKQSLKAKLPVIHDLIPFALLIKSTAAQGKYIAYVDNANPLNLQTAIRKNEDTIVLIGPEGDFSPTEVQAAIDHGFVKVSLGASRLRTETAAIAACHIVNLANA